MRFFISRDSVVSTLLKHYALLHHFCCVTSNIVWQLCYLAKLYNLGVPSWDIVFFLSLVVGWVQAGVIIGMRRLRRGFAPPS